MSLKSEGPRLNPSSTFSDSVTWARCSPNLLLPACKSRFINTVWSFEFCVRGSAELSLAASSPGGKKGRSLWCLRSAASDQLSALWRVRMARAPCSARGEHSLACVSSLAARGGLGHAVLILPQETTLSKQLAHPA